MKTNPKYVNFTFEQFSNYIKSKLSYLVKLPTGEWEVIYDSSILQLLNVPKEIHTENDTIKWIYDNQKFDDLLKLIEPM